MDPLMFKAAKDGDVQALLGLLQDDSIILDRFTATTTDTPLHVAALFGHLEFVKELMRNKKSNVEEYMKELNQHGFSAMRLAASNGHVEVVKELFEASHEFCSLKGKDGLTPLHCASIKGRVDIIVQLSSASPACISDVTIINETAIHLTVKNCRLDALTTLLGVIKNNNMLEILNGKDEDGNTALHLAAARRNSQAIQLLVNCNQGTTPGGWALQVNASNNKGLTALDLFLLCPCEFGNHCNQVETLLRHAGGSGTQVIPDIKPSTPSHTHTEILPTPPNPSLLLEGESWVEYFKFQYGRDNRNDVRNVLLVVAVLMATAAFQSVLTLPGSATLLYLLLCIIQYHVELPLHSSSGT